MKTRDLQFPKRELVEVRINAAGRVTITNPPKHLAEVLDRAASGVYEIGRANRHDFFIEAPREPEAQRHLAVRLAKAAIDNCPAIL